MKMKLIDVSKLLVFAWLILSLFLAPVAVAGQYNNLEFIKTENVAYDVVLPGNFAKLEPITHSDGFTKNSRISLYAGPGLAFPVDVINISSSTISLSWNPVSGAASYNIYITPEPETLGNYTWMKLMGNNSGNTNTTFIIKDVAAAVDTFIRVEAINASGVFAAGDAYARTIGGQLAQIEFEYGNRNKLDTPLKEIHLASPNIIHLILFNPEVHSYSGINNWIDDGVNEVINYTGWDWHAGNWSVTRKNGDHINVTKVFRRSVPAGQFDPDYASYLEFDHHIYLVLDEQVGNSEILQISHSGGANNPDSFELDHPCMSNTKTLFGKNG